LAISYSCTAQEVHMYGGRGGGIGIPEVGGNDELQDEGELASALGMDRQALYEDLMRIQEQLGGSPLAGNPQGPGPLGPMGDQSSQEQEDY